MTQDNDSIQPFYAMTIGRLAFQMQEAGRSVLHMEYGQPSVQPPEAVRNAAAGMLDDGVKGYWESDALKQAISEKYRVEHGCEVPADRIILTCGASPALALGMMAAFAPGARIAMTRPGYVAHRNVVIGLHMQPVELPCGPETRFQMTAAMLDAIDPAPDGVIISSPANPTGSIIPSAELEAIAQVCARKNIQIISDEIYSQITYDQPAPSMAKYAPNAILADSFSKFHAMPGWRLGWVVLPEHLMHTGHAYMSNFFLTPPSLSQAAGLVALSCTEELSEHVEVYRKNRALLLETLPEIGLTDIAPPDGAFYIYARTDAFFDDSRELCMELLKDTGIATAPGVDFDVVDGHRFMRMSFAVTHAEIREALERMAPWFATKKRQQRPSLAKAR